MNVDVNDIALKCDRAIDSKNGNEIENLISELTSFSNNDNLSELQLSHIIYCIGNLYAGVSAVYGEDSSGWRSDEFPVNRAKAINYYRRALEIAERLNSSAIHEIRTNLANEIAHHRRNIECLEVWQCDMSMDGDAPFVSACTKARELLWVRHWLNDEKHADLYAYTAYSLLKFLKTHLKPDSHPDILRYVSESEQSKAIITFGDEHFDCFKDWDKTDHQEDYDCDEKKYRHWCLQNRLFLNSLNDITTEWIADRDILQFPSHTVAVDQGPYFSAAFSSLKREYCFARHLAYEGFHGVHPEFENKGMFLTDTMDYVEYGGHIEKIKTSFRVCFSILDSLSVLMNNYFGCQSKQPSFSSRWIRENLKDYECYFVDALYWLACDLTDITNIPNEKWKAPNPAGMQIRRMRNEIEHGWLRVADGENDIWNKENDFAYVISQQELKKNALFVLKTVRSAIIYFCLAVNFTEKNRVKKSGLHLTIDTPLINDIF